MSVGVKITKDLGNNKYEIEVTPVDTKNHILNFGVAHDYVLFSTYTAIYTDDNVRIKDPAGGGSSNMLPILASIQIPIKMMGQVILPELNASDSLKPEHFNDYGVWSSKKVQMWADGEFLWIYDGEKKEYVKISRSVYNLIKNK